MTKIKKIPFIFAFILLTIPFVFLTLEAAHAVAENEQQQLTAE
jgi:hypothetical protein